MERAFDVPEVDEEEERVCLRCAWRRMDWNSLVRSWIDDAAMMDQKVSPTNRKKIL